MELGNTFQAGKKTSARFVFSSDLLNLKISQILLLEHYKDGLPLQLLLKTLCYILKEFFGYQMGILEISPINAAQSGGF